MREPFPLRVNPEMFPTNSSLLILNRWVPLKKMKVVFVVKKSATLFAYYVRVSQG